MGRADTELHMCCGGRGEEIVTAARGAPGSRVIVTMIAPSAIEMDASCAILAGLCARVEIGGPQRDDTKAIITLSALIFIDQRGLRQELHPKENSRFRLSMYCAALRSK